MTESSQHDAAATRVSIVIPAYNVAHLIHDAIDSAFAQTVTDVEVIVVNDGSPDTPALEAVIASYGNRVRYISQQNGGPSAARNAGVKAARGEFVAFLDADDRLLPFFLEEHLARAAADPDADVFYGDLRVFGQVAEAGRTVMEFNPSSGSVDFESLVTQRCNPTMCSMVRRRTLLAYGPFDTSLRRSEDFDLWLRLAHDGVRFNYTHRVVGEYCVRPDGLAADLVSMIQSIRAVLDKCTRTMRLSTAERQLLEARSRHFSAQQRLYEGKRAFLAGDHAAARAALREANASLRSWKLRLVLLALAIAPRLTESSYRSYERIRGRSDPARQ